LPNYDGSHISTAFSIDLNIKKKIINMIPDYQSIMLPLLKLISDGREHKMRNLTDELAIKLGVTDRVKKRNIHYYFKLHKRSIGIHAKK